MAMTIRPDGSMQQQPANAITPELRAQVSYDEKGALKKADLQKAAWDLGYDKKLSGRIEKELTAQAFQVAAQDSGATVKDFAEDTVAQLKNFGVGEDDAKALVDAYVQQDLGAASDDTTALKSLFYAPAKKDADEVAKLFVTIENGSTINKDVAAIADEYIKADGKMTPSIERALKDSAGAYVQNHGLQSTIGDFSKDLADALEHSGVVPQAAEALVTQWQGKYFHGAKADDSLNEFVGGL